MTTTILMRSSLEELKKKAKTIFESEIEKMFFFNVFKTLKKKSVFFSLMALSFFVHCERMKVKREIKCRSCDESLSLQQYTLLQKINIFM